MKKNVLFWIGVKSKNKLLREKHGDFKYFEISRLSWEYWCEKNDVIFLPYEEPSRDDTGKHKATWQRWFDVFNKIEEANIDYDKIASIDGSTIIRWDCPNFFDLVKNNTVTAWRALENLRWVSEGVDGYNNLFDNFNFDLKKYINCGFQIFDKNHKKFLIELEDFYDKNNDQILDLQNNKVKRGTDQPVYNYLLQMSNVKVDISLPPAFLQTHHQRFDWFSHNWQLNEDKTPFFIKYGYIHQYSGFPQRGQRFQLMSQTWDLIKENYK